MIHAPFGRVAEFMNEHVKNASGVVQCGADENFIVAVIGAGVSPTFTDRATALGIRGESA
jgi:hypothetical protein